MVLLLSALPLVTAAGIAEADPGFQPDYYLVMQSCKILGAPLYQVSAKDDPMPVLPVQGLVQACERKPKKRLSCLTSFMEENAKVVPVEYKVDIESADYALWRTSTWGDYVVIDPSQRSAVLTVRMLSDKTSATKVCHGLFLTADEFHALAEQSKQTDDE